VVRWRHSIKVLLQYSLTDLQFASERLARLRRQSASAAIVVCIAARVLNKMSMMTTGEGLRGIHILGLPHSFLNRGLLEVNPAHLQLQQITHPQSGDEFK